MDLMSGLLNGQRTAYNMYPESGDQQLNVWMNSDK